MSENTVQLKESDILDIIDKNRALDATYKLVEIILESPNFEEMAQKIADTIPNALGYELGLLCLIDPQKDTLEKVAVSKVGEEANLKVLELAFEKLSIPLNYKENWAIQAIDEVTPKVTDSIYDFFKPIIPQSDSEKIQRIMKTKSHIALPLVAHEDVIGVLIVCLAKEQREIKDFEKQMLTKFSENAGIAIENSRLYSNLKKAKDDLHKAYENLKVLNKMKDEFLSVASHELRTPMTIVKSYLWMLEKNKAGNMNNRQKEYLEKATTGTQRMIDLINDMLDISKFEQKKIKFEYAQTEMCQLLSEVLASFDVIADEKGIKLKFAKECSDMFVDVDENKMRHVLVNLIENSVKFTKEGGVTVGIDDKDDHIKIWIKDTGSGIAKEDLSKLFHKFGRIDNSYTIASESGGTGLGLYIVKLYVEGMGGKVGAFSEGPNKGSMFWITLPKTRILQTQEQFKALKDSHIPL